MDPSEYDDMEQMDMLEGKINELTEELTKHGAGKCIFLVEIDKLWEDSWEEALKLCHDVDDEWTRAAQADIFERKLKALKVIK
jgi:hypothetical protein